MTFKRAIWFPIAALLGLGNLVALGFAAAQGEPGHAMLHAALALAFGYWARRLQLGPDRGDRQGRLEDAEAYESLEALEAEVRSFGRSWAKRRSAWTSPSGCWHRDRNPVAWGRSPEIQRRPPCPCLPRVQRIRTSR